MIKLSANENPFRHSLNMGELNFEALLSQVELNRYPDPTYWSLKEALVPLLTGGSPGPSLSSSQLTLGNGSDELIWLIFSALLTREDLVLVPNPSFSEYDRLARLSKIKLTKPEPDLDFNIDLVGLGVLANRLGAKMLVVCQPNNPTGQAFSREEVLKLLTLYKGYVVLDEAYIEFSSEPSALDLIKSNPNLIVLRTLSKAYGLAGLRLGICLSSEAVAMVLNEARPPYNLSQVTQVCLEWLLKQPGLTQRMQEEVVTLQRERERLIKNLTNLGLKVFKSEGNFFLIQECKTTIGVDSTNLREAILKAGVDIRAFPTGPLKDCLRVTIGRPEDNDLVLTILEDLLGPQEVRCG